jgi:biopolymer transport protein ExbB
MTIAVSGAPFLGLLGTVVGVMITFASIAATGDVNVNTIAPGVAAALFATVAGLLVAIPSLFGYNFIASRVGARVSAMDVFADQLVARFAAAFTGRSAAAELTHAP